jgi:hypothetical protein
MGYVIVAVLVLLIVVAGVALFLRSARQPRGAAAADRDLGGGTPGTDAAIAAPDRNTPLGDTDQHAGVQTQEGATVAGQDAEGSGGTGRAVGGGYAGTGEVGDRRRDREHGTTPSGGHGGVGGEAEGSRPVAPPE